MILRMSPPPLAGTIKPQTNGKVQRKKRQLTQRTQTVLPQLSCDAVRNLGASFDNSKTGIAIVSIALKHNTK